MPSPCRWSVLLAITLQCCLGHEHGRDDSHAGAQLSVSKNSSSSDGGRGLVMRLRDASAPFKASGTAKESWYRCADYCPLRPGQKNIVEFRCLNGACVSIGMYCNGFPNCADGSDENDCPKTTPRPHNCSDQKDEWGKAWSVDKKAWCCQHKQIGCLPAHVKPQNCEDDKDRWQEAWSTEQKLWCCALLGRGCGPATTTHTTVTTTTLTTKTSTTRTATTITGTVTHTTGTTATTTVTSTTRTRSTTTSTGTETATTSTLTTTTFTTTTKTSTTSTTATTTTVTTTFTSRTTTTTFTTTVTSTTHTTTTTFTTISTTTRTVTSTTSTTSSSTSTTSSTTTPEPVALAMSCAEKGISYNPIDMFGSFPKQVGNIAECQAMCAHKGGCVHYSYWVPQRVCHLHDKDAVRSSLLTKDFISGPPSCPQRNLRVHLQLPKLTFGPADSVAPLQKKFVHKPWRQIQDTIHNVAGRLGLLDSAVLLTAVLAVFATVSLFASTWLVVKRWRVNQARPHRRLLPRAVESSDSEDGDAPVTSRSPLVSASATAGYVLVTT